MKEKYVLKLEGKEWKDCLDKSFQKKRKEVKFDGFRKGQVPQEVYIKKFGLESLYMDAVDYAVDILYAKLMEDPKTVSPVATPGMDVKKISKDEVEIEFTLVSSPKIKLGKYKKLGLKKEIANATDEEIEHELGHIKEQFADVKTLEDNDSLKDGNIAIIDFEGFLNDKPFNGGKGTDYSLTLGSHTFIPGFEEGLVGLKKGDKKDLTVTFPENYQSDELKGKEVVFKVEVKEIKERVYPEFNDDFFKDLNIEKVSSLADLKKYIKENIESEKDKQLQDEFLFKCLDKINEDAKYEVPEEMTEDETNRIVKEFSERLQTQGLKLEDYLKFSNSDMNKFKESFKDEANKRIGYRLILNEIISLEKLEVSESEVEEGIKQASQLYGVSEEEFINQIGSKETFKYDMLMKKAISIIAE